MLRYSARSLDAMVIWVVFLESLLILLRLCDQIEHIILEVLVWLSPRRLHPGEGSLEDQPQTSLADHVQGLLALLFGEALCGGNNQPIAWVPDLSQRVG